MNNLNELFDEPYKIIRFKKFIKGCNFVWTDCQYSIKQTVCDFLTVPYTLCVSDKNLDIFLENVKKSIKDGCTRIPVGSFLMEILFEGEKISDYYIIGEDGDHLMEELTKEEIKVFNGFVEKNWSKPND